MSASELQTDYDSGLVISSSGSTGIVTATAGSINAQEYCISAVSDGHRAYVEGPGDQVQNDTAATADPCSGFTGS